ncbi:MAG: CDIF630_02480 family spore surface protein [Halothermotrichaceae bacterium]
MLQDNNPNKNKKNNKMKQQMMETPVENHLTAAWANIEKLEGKARVFNPSYLGAEQAKEYVDENEK